MSDDRTTRDLDQFALLRALVERAAAENAASNASLALEMRSVVGTVDGLRHEVHRLGGRVTDVEGDIREIRDRHTTTTRHQSASDLTHETNLGAAISQVQRLERVNEALCNELGLDHRAIIEGGVSIPPPGGKLPKTTLRKIANENKGGLLVSALTLAVVVAEVVAHLLGVHLVGL